MTERDKQLSYKEKMEQEFGRKPKDGYHFVRSLGGNNKVVEIKDGTPKCCDPSTELYWAM